MGRQTRGQWRVNSGTAPTASWSCRSPLIHEAGRWGHGVTRVSLPAARALTCVGCHGGRWAEFGSVYILREQLFQNQCCQAARHTHSLLLRSIRGPARGPSLPQMLETSNLTSKLAAFIPFCTAFVGFNATGVRRCAPSGRGPPLAWPRAPQSLAF